jgi:hypothetical protein
MNRYLYIDNDGKHHPILNAHVVAGKVLGIAITGFGSRKQVELELTETPTPGKCCPMPLLPIPS